MKTKVYKLKDINKHMKNEIQLGSRTIPRELSSQMWTKRFYCKKCKKFHDVDYSGMCFNCHSHSTKSKEAKK